MGSLSLKKTGLLTYFLLLWGVFLLPLGVGDFLGEVQTFSIGEKNEFEINV